MLFDGNMIKSDHWVVSSIMEPFENLRSLWSVLKPKIQKWYSRGRLKQFWKWSGRCDETVSFFIDRNRWNSFMFLIGPNETVSILFLVSMKLFHCSFRSYWNCFNFRIGPYETVSLSKRVLMKLFQFWSWSYWNCFTFQKGSNKTAPFSYHRN